MAISAHTPLCLLLQLPTDLDGVPSVGEPLNPFRHQQSHLPSSSVTDGVDKYFCAVIFSPPPGVWPTQDHRVWLHPSQPAGLDPRNSTVQYSTVQYSTLMTYIWQIQSLMLSPTTTSGKPLTFSLLMTCLRLTLAAWASAYILPYSPWTTVAPIVRPGDTNISEVNLKRILRQFWSSCQARSCWTLTLEMHSSNYLFQLLAEMPV